MPSVIASGVSRKKPSHECGDSRCSASQKKMGVFGHKCPCVALRLYFRQEDRKPFDKVLTVFIVIKYPSALYSSDDNMVQEAGRIKSGHSRHTGNMQSIPPDGNLLDYLRIIPLFTVLICMVRFFTLSFPTNILGQKKNDYFSTLKLFLCHNRKLGQPG